MEEIREKAKAISTLVQDVNITLSDMNLERYDLVWNAAYHAPQLLGSVIWIVFRDDQIFGHIFTSVGKLNPIPKRRSQWERTH